MLQMKDGKHGSIDKNLARKMVLNISDADLDTDKESFDNDIYCPSWLNPKKVSQIVSSNRNNKIEFCSNESMYNSSKTNKRNIDESPQVFNLSGEKLQKKIDSPIQDSFFLQSNLLAKFQNVLIEFLESEIEYFKNIYMCQSIYNSLLQNVTKYKSIFTAQEKLLLFQDIIILAEISKTFIKSLVDNLVLFNGFSNQRSLEKVKVDDENHRLFDYNIRQLVINSNIHKLKVGSVMHNMFKASNFKPTILAFFAKHNFRMKILKHKISYGGPSVDKWLKEANFLIKYKSKSWSLESILIQPLQRIMKYPLLIKQLIDSSSVLGYEAQKHDLNLALIKVNLIIDACNKQDSLSSYDEIDEKQRKVLIEKKAPEVPFDTNLEMRIPIEHEVRLDKATTTKLSRNNWFPLKDFLFAPKERILPKREGQYAYLVTSFRDKYFQMKRIQLAFESFSKLLENFILQQSKYASLWKQFLQENDSREGAANYIDSIYSSYVDKMKVQSLATQLLIEEINTKVISAISLVISYCDDVKIQIQLHRKLRSSYVSYIKECEQNKHKPNIFQKTYSKAQTCINIENQLKDKLPRLLEYLCAFLSLLQSHSIRLYLDWLKQQIGERSLHEFQQIRNLMLSSPGAKHKHADIVQFYQNNVQLTKIALEERQQGLDYLHRFSAM